MTEQMWDDPTPTYRPNWRDRARWAREAAESDAGTLADPGPLLAALVEAGVLREERKEWQDDIGDDKDVRLAASVRRQIRPGLFEYVDPRPVRYVTDWRPADD